MSEQSEEARGKYPSEAADRYILRFDRPGHREALKASAARAKRSLNKHLLMLIEAGEAAQREVQQ